VGGREYKPALRAHPTGRRHYHAKERQGFVYSGKQKNKVAYALLQGINAKGSHKRDGI
jgi:hypothetical protein